MLYFCLREDKLKSSHVSQNKQTKCEVGTGNAVTPINCREWVLHQLITLEGIILTGSSRDEHAVVQTLSIIF